MRTRAPEPFTRTFRGPTGLYVARFEPIDEWDGWLVVSGLGDEPLRWSVFRCDETNGVFEVSGMTSGAKPSWADEFWFVLKLSPAPSVIEYWGDQVLVRTDTES